jgi:hypothetical protein
MENNQNNYLLVRFFFFFFSFARFGLDALRFGADGALKMV